MYWTWEDAFYSRSFDEGRGDSETETVADFLREAGYEVDVTTFSKNPIITSIKKDGVEHIGPDDWMGDSDPRDYLTAQVVDLLDKQFPEDQVDSFLVNVPTTFAIDTKASTKEYLYVEIGGFCTVAIKRETEGIVVDLYALHGVGRSLASICATEHECRAVLDDNKESPGHG
jgi:hypothetical protein